MQRARVGPAPKVAEVHHAAPRRSRDAVLIAVRRQPPLTSRGTIAGQPALGLRRMQSADAPAASGSGASWDFTKIPVFPPERPAATAGLVMLRRAPARPDDVTASAPPAADPQTVTTALPGQPSAQPADDPFCLNTRPGQGPERCEFTAKQQQTVGFERYAAASLTSQALTNLSRGDPYLTTLAKRVFHAANPDMSQIRSTTSQILDNLRSKPVVCGTCADEDCYTAGVVAHVTDDLSTIVLCQRFFQTSIGEMRRTLVHEAGHAAGVGSGGPPPEMYCAEGSTGCVDPCSNLSGDLSQNVDAWARFIECAAQSG